MSAFVSEIFLTWFEVDDRGIRNHGVWYRHYFYEWNKIERIDSIRLSRSTDEMGIFVYEGEHKLKIRSVMTNMPEFAALVKKNLPEEKWKGAEATIMKYYRRLKTPI